MKKELANHSGLERLLEKYRGMFRTPENLNHYSEKDFELAERKFLKYALTHRIVDWKEEPFDPMIPEKIKL